MRQLAGLPDDWKGTIHDTAAVSCVVARLCARVQASGHSQERAGLQGESAPLVVYTTEHAHSSVSKAALLAGFGRDNLRSVATDSHTYAMSPAALAAAVDDDRAAGRVPAAVVASVGTTGTTAIDPLREIVSIAQSAGAWVHVDAAMAGSALLLPERRSMFDGLDGADSLSWNPHKWMGTILDTSLFYTRRPDHLVRVMSTNPSYLRSVADGDVTQYRDWGIPLGRRFRALKLWFHLRIDGVDAIRERMRRDLANAQWLADQVAAAPDWEVVAPVALQTVCVRHHPSGLDGDGLDRHTLGWVDGVNASGSALITPSVLDGRWMARVSIGAEQTERGDVAAVWTLMQAAAESELARGQTP
jgi:aromatic-L-amino-acid decarboxylase